MTLLLIHYRVSLSKFYECDILSGSTLFATHSAVSITVFPIIKRNERIVSRVKFITKTRLYSFDLLKLHFYIVNFGFTGVYINFLISAQKHGLWVL